MRGAVARYRTEYHVISSSELFGVKIRNLWLLCVMREPKRACMHEVLRARVGNGPVSLLYSGYAHQVPIMATAVTGPAKCVTPF